MAIPTRVTRLPPPRRAAEPFIEIARPALSGSGIETFVLVKTLDRLLLPVDHRKTEGGAWGGRTPTGSLLIDDDETVDAVNG